MAFWCCALHFLWCEPWIHAAWPWKPISWCPSLHCSWTNLQTTWGSDICSWVCRNISLIGWVAVLPSHFRFVVTVDHGMHNVTNFIFVFIAQKTSQFQRKWKVLWYMFVDAVVMLRCWRVYICGHESDWNTGIQEFGFVNQHLWLCRIYISIAFKNSLYNYIYVSYFLNWITKINQLLNYNLFWNNDEGSLCPSHLLWALLQFKACFSFHPHTTLKFNKKTIKEKRNHAHNIEIMKYWYGNQYPAWGQWT